MQVLCSMSHTGCEEGTYGEGCRRLCDCPSGVPCDPATGRCLCPPGKTGPTCAAGELSPSWAGEEGDCVTGILLPGSWEGLFFWCVSPHRARGAVALTSLARVCRQI